MKLAGIEKLTVLNGDGTMPSVLEDAGAGGAIALTPKNEENLAACELCKKKFRVRKAVVLLTDPKKTNLFFKMGIDGVV